MKRNITRFLSIVVSVTLLAVLCVPAFATSGSQYEQKIGFWAWATHLPVLKEVVGYVSGSVCPESEDGYHHANSSQCTHKNLFGQDTAYYDCICSYCGQTFTAFESDLQQSYQQQVSTLPASGIGKDGFLYYYLPLSYMCASSSELKYEIYSPSSGKENSDSGSPLVTFDESSGYCFLRLASGSLSTYCVVTYFYDFVAPIDGTYTYVSCPYSVGAYSIFFDSGVQGRFSHNTSPSLPNFYSAGFSQEIRLVVGRYSSKVYIDSKVPEPFIFKIAPVSGAVDIASDYNITTRPTAINGGNYGIVGDDGQIITINNPTKIINEGDNIYYNPATGQTYTITDWTYNYDGRIYNITLDTGDKVSVEYGDENITITENTVNEGDTIVNNYTIYYMIDGSGSGDNPDPTPGPTACPHEWLKTGERQATCLVPAQRTYTCSICGEQKTETDPVLGHSWHAIQTVTTQYDENGNMTQEGYTIYECERCGEQYKSTNDTGPPPSGGGGSGGGSGDNIFSGIFGLIWDFFTFLFDLFSEFVVGGIKGFIGGLKDAGSSFFSILNPFNWDYGG